MPTHLERLKQVTEGWVGMIVKLIVLFLLQLLVVPAILFWILYQVGLALLDTTRRSN
jgi:hypothetical protein